ncbi:MAG: hypothetical protein RR282_00780 [Acinetobacter sp.]
MTQESVLVITVDARNAERRITSLDRTLTELQQSGNEASDSIEQVGDTANQQTSRMDNLRNSLSSLASEGKTYLAGLAGAAVGSAGALVALAIQTSNAAAEIERLAYLSGTTTTEFQEWAAGAQAMGIDMEKLSDIFKDVQDRVGDFITTGGGEMSDFFKEIATKTEGSAAGALKLAKSMRDLSGAEALQLYVNKLKEAGVGQNEMIFYMESMADEATSLIPLLENGGEGFQAWAEAARNAGAIMNDETIAAARQLKIETQLLEMQMAGIKNEFMGGLIPALNQVLSAFTGTSTQALNMRTAGEMLGNTLIGLTKIGMGVAATFDIVGRVIGGTAAALTSEAVTHQMVIDDIGAGIDEWGKKFNKVNTSVSNDKTMKTLLEVQERANENARAVGKGALNAKNMKDALDDSAKSAKKVTDNTAKLKREAEQAAEEVRKIMYQYSSEESQKAIDLQKEITRLQKYGQTQYIEVAKGRHEEERKLSKMNFEYNLIDFRLSEKEKLKYSFSIKEQEIIADTKLTDEQTKLKLASLKIQFKQEMFDVELAKKQRIFEATEFQYSEMERIAKRYELEREEISKTHTEAERNILLQASKSKQQKEMNDLLSQTKEKWKSINDEMMGSSDTSAISDNRVSNLASAQALFDQEIALAQTAERREQIWAEHKQRMINIEADFYGKSQAYQLKQTADTFGALAGVYLNFEDETSKTYAHIVAIQKGANLASVIMNSYAAISAAWASAPFPYNLPAVAATTVQTGVLTAAMQAFTPTGFESGGYTGNMGTKAVAGVVHGQEYVFNAKATKNIGKNNLESLAKTGELPNQKQAQPTTNIINVFDESELRNAMATPSGEKIIMNVIKRNRSKLGI